MLYSATGYSKLSCGQFRDFLVILIAVIANKMKSTRKAGKFNEKVQHALFYL